MKVPYSLPDISDAEINEVIDTLTKDSTHTLYN